MTREFISTNDECVENNEGIKTIIHHLENKNIHGDVWLSCRRQNVATISSAIFHALHHICHKNVGWEVLSHSGLCVSQVFWKSSWPCLITLWL